MPHIVVPPHAGNFSAWGLLGADLVRSGGRTERLPLTPDSLVILNARIREITAELHARGGSDTTGEATEREVALGMRFRGQEHSLTIPIQTIGESIVGDAKALRAAFCAAYQRDFGVVLDNPVEVIAIRCSHRRRLPRRTLLRAAHEQLPVAPKLRPRVRVYSFAQSVFIEAMTWEREELVQGKEIIGPAIIYEPTTTTYVDVDYRVHVDHYGSMHLIHADHVSKLEA
jgi:N-methylhydantoinase A